MSGGTSTPKAHGDGTGTPAEGTETPAEGTETPAEGTETPAEGTPAETPAEGTETPAEEPQPAEDKTGTGPENKATMGVLINGVRVTDPVKIQNHIDALTTAQDEARTEGRKAFIKSLAEGNSPKIAASQITATELFALDLDDDKWNAWVKTWDAAPGNPLFAKHGGGTSNHDGAGSTPANEREAEIEKLEAIVNFHRQSGKTKEQIESMQSWQKLQQLKPSTES